MLEQIKIILGSGFYIGTLTRTIIHSTLNSYTILVPMLLCLLSKS